MEWGQRGTLECRKILDTAKGPVDGPPEEAPENEGQARQTAKPVQAGETAAIPPEKIEPDPAEVGDGEESDLSEVPDLADAPAAKKAKKEDALGGDAASGGGLSWEEYEAMLEKEDEAGGFMEGVDLYDVKT